MPLAIAPISNAGNVEITVTGSGGNTINAYSCQAGTAWTFLGLVTGDGLIVEPLDDGFYFFYAVNTTTNETTAVSARTKLLNEADEAASLHYRLLLATQARFQDVVLNGITDTSILVVKMPDTKALEKDRSAAFRMPGILIAQGKSEKLVGGTNTRDDVSYPVAVYVFAKDEKELTENHNKYLRWREQLIHSVINQRLDDVPEQFFADIEPGPIMHDGSWMNGLLASAFTIRYTARRSRGLI